MIRNTIHNPNNNPGTIRQPDITGPRNPTEPGTPQIFNQDKTKEGVKKDKTKEGE